MKTPRRWLAGAGIAAVAIGVALFAGGLGFAHWGDDHAYPGPYGHTGPAYGSCPMWDEDDRPRPARVEGDHEG